MRHYLRLISELPFSVKWLLITEMFYGFAMGIWGVNLNFHLIDRGYSDAGVGNLIAFGSVLTAAVSLFAGGICDKLGYRQGMVGGCLVRALGVVLMGLAPQPSYILLGQVLFSIGGAFLRSSELPLLLGLVEDRYMQVVYNLSFCAYQFAMLFGNILGGRLPGYLQQQFSQYGFSIMICAVMFALMGMGRQLLPKVKSENPNGKLSLAIVTNPMIFWFLIYGVLGGITANIVLPLSMVNMIYRNNFKLSDSMIGISYSLSTFISALAYFIAPVILERWKHSRLAYVIFTFNILSFACFTSVGVVMFVVLWLGFSFFNSVLPGAVETPMLQMVSHKDRGSYCGLGISANCIGMGIGGILSGWFLNYMNYSSLMLVGIGIFVIQALIYKLKCLKYLSENVELK